MIAKAVTPRESAIGCIVDDHLKISVHEELPF